MRRILTILCLILLVGFATIAVSQTAQKTVVVVNPENPITEAKRVDIANLFLGKKTQWESGLKAKPVDVKKSAKESKPKAGFLDKILQMKEKAYKSYWVEKMLSGEAEPPKSLDTEEKILEFIKANKGAVAYLSAETAKKPEFKGSVKILPITEIKDQPGKVQEW